MPIVTKFFLAGGGSPAPASYVARLNGNQAWEMSEQLIDVDNLEGLLIQGYWEAGYGILIGQGNSNGTDFRIYEGDNGKITAQIGGEYTVDFADSVTGYVEILFTGGNLIYSVDGVELHNDTYAIGGARLTDVTVIGGRINDDGSVGFAKEGFVKDVTISQSGTVLFDSTLTDKDAGQVQASTVGSVTATMINYDESVWVEYIEPDWFSYLNGTSQAWSFGEKLIDVDNLDGTTLEVEFNTDSEGTMIGQCVGGSSEREFQYFKFGDEVKLRIGGEDVSLGDLTTVGVHKLEFAGGNVNISLNDVNVYSGAYPTGASREPTAVTTLNRRGGGNFKEGGALNFKVTKNGVVTYENSLTNRDDRGLQKPTVGAAVGTLEDFTPTVWQDYYVRDADIDAEQVLLFMGASIMERSFDQTTRTEDAYLAKGLDITTYCRALGGDTSLDTRIKTISVIKEFSKVTKQKSVFVHTGGNDVSVYGPYPGGATGIGENITALAQLFKADGFKLIMTPISYRIPPASNPTEPYNTNIVDGLVSQYADHSVDMHTFTLNAGDAYFGAGGGDGIHPSDPDGEVLTVNYVVDNTYQYIQSL